MNKKRIKVFKWIIIGLIFLTFAHWFINSFFGITTEHATRNIITRECGFSGGGYSLLWQPDQTCLGILSPNPSQTYAYYGARNIFNKKCQMFEYTKPRPIWYQQDSNCDSTTNNSDLNLR